MQLKEERTGIRFTSPCWIRSCSLPLSTRIRSRTNSDVILERLGIAIGKRHNALEDALVTGEVFLKLVKLLEDQGIVTVRQALEAAEKTYFARIKY